MGRPSTPIAERFEAKVDRSGGPDACHLWTGSTNFKGYGRLMTASGVQLAHRIAWELENGLVPVGQLVRHLVCDNPPCVNLRHLACGSAADNTADMLSADRHARKLSDAAVLLIRGWLTHGYSRGSIARAFEVSKRTIQFIERGRLHARVKHV